MFKGTTPTIKWHIKNTNVKFEEFEKVWMTFKDSHNHAITREESEDKHELQLDDKKRTISYELTQEETLALCLGTIEVQIRVLFKSGQAWATKPMTFELERVLKGGVI